MRVTCELSATFGEIRRLPGVRSIAYYREQAAKVRRLAAEVPDAVVRARLEAVAEEYDKLADQLEWGITRPPPDAPSLMSRGQ